MEEGGGEEEVGAEHSERVFKFPERSGSVLAVTQVRQVSKSITLMASDGGEECRCVRRDGGAFTDRLQSVFSYQKEAKTGFTPPTVAQRGQTVNQLYFLQIYFYAF